MVRIGFIAANHQADNDGGGGQFQLRTKIISEPASKEQITSWQKGQFIDVNSLEISNLLNSVVSSKEKLSVKQKAELQDSASRFFHAYTIGGFENYFEFKSHGTTYSLVFDSDTEQLIKALQASRTNSIPFPEEPKAKLETIWEMISGASTNGVGPTITQIDPNSIQIHLSVTNSDPIEWIFQKSGAAVKKNPNTMNPSFAPYSFFKYDESPDLLSKGSGQFITAMLEVDARYSTSELSAPLYVVLYWSSREMAWHPWVLGKYSTVKFKVLF